MWVLWRFNSDVHTFTDWIAAQTWAERNGFTLQSSIQADANYILRKEGEQASYGWLKQARHHGRTDVTAGPG